MPSATDPVSMQQTIKSLRQLLLQLLDPSFASWSAITALSDTDLVRHLARALAQRHPAMATAGTRGTSEEDRPWACIYDPGTGPECAMLLSAECSAIGGEWYKDKECSGFQAYLRGTQ